VVVLVAVNDHGNPTAVTPWSPETELELAQHQYAVQLMEMRSRVEGLIEVYKPQ
jgi:acyl-CoA hydrolase